MFRAPATISSGYVSGAATGRLSVLMAFSNVRRVYSEHKSNLGGYSMLSWLLWFIGILIAVAVGLSVFHVYDVPFVIDQIRTLGTDALTKALFIALALVALSKLAS